MSHIYTNPYSSVPRKKPSRTTTTTEEYEYDDKGNVTKRRVTTVTTEEEAPSTWQWPPYQPPYTVTYGGGLYQ